jgi:hypothetical protein
VRHIADEPLAPGLRAVSVLVPTGLELSPAEVAAFIRQTKQIPTEVECHGEGQRVAGGVHWVFLFTG